MPTPAGSHTNEYKCDACGRYFNTRQEIQEHQRDCIAAHQSGSTNKPDKEADKGEDRDWVSTP